MKIVEMRSSAETRYDVASAISVGQRDYQEDALISDFQIGSELGFAVLADGMGGHAAGDVASKIVVTEVFSELKLQSGDPRRMEANIANVLLGAAMTANDCVRSHIGTFPGTEGMGATLLAPVVMRDRLYWISIGDSPLFLFRDGELAQLNEDHSMAPQIDYLVRSGLMDIEAAVNHPDRNCLTSVLAGQQIPRIDCPKSPVRLRDGDIVIAASDGLQFLDEAEIGDLLRDNADASSSEISNILLGCLEDLADPDQDNIAFCIIKVHRTARPALRAPVAAPDVPVRATVDLPQTPGRKETLTIMASKSDKSLSMMYRVSSERTA